MFSLYLQALFCCVSADHVLLDQHNVCKMTGFAAADVIRSKEKEEEALGVMSNLCRISNMKYMILPNYS
jgi:hypothetical protein